MPDPRCVLFLQGPLSSLYADVGAMLQEHGLRVRRINLCIGDRLHWRHAGAVDYRGRPDDWHAFIDAFLEREAVTDLVLHGDRRLYHRIAAQCAHARGIRVITTELGYLRPDWLTLERDGTARHSRFPRDPDAIRRIASGLPRPDLRVRYPVEFRHVALPDLTYNLPNSLLWFLYPHYRSHTGEFAPLVYAAWLLRKLTAPLRERRVARLSNALFEGDRPLFVVPLQLQSDLQIRENSPFDGIAEATETLLQSFARHAPPAAVLVFKTHPHDLGLQRWPATIGKQARRLGIGARVRVLDGGQLAPLFAHCTGVVTINSTAGLEALMAGCPVKTLSPTLYDIPGMTHQGHLDAFWSQPDRPNESLVDDFVTALAGTVQVRGSIHSSAGIQAAARQMAGRILSGRINQPAADP